MSDKFYNVLKWVIVIVIPAAETALISYGELFNWPTADIIAKALIIAATFLGASFCISSANYYAKKANGKVSLVPEEDEQDNE